MPTLEIEARIRAHHEEDSHDTAATVLLEAYGPQILGFLTSRLRSESDALEVFSIFCEDLWKGLPAFAWRCSALAWAYTIARHAESRFRKSPHRRRERNVALSDAPAALAMADRVRTTTLPFMRTEIKDRFRDLRDQLTDDEQLLLVLRVDKRLPWTDIVHVMSDGNDMSAPVEKTEAARLRKRFQLLKEKLRNLGEAEGLLAAD